jgi:thermosome
MSSRGKFPLYFLESFLNTKILELIINSKKIIINSKKRNRGRKKMNNQQPIVMLSEGTQRTQGISAQKQNFMIAKEVANIVRTTLGPKGMDKMIVDSMGDVIVTNDGVTILNEMQLDHPIGKMMVEIAKTQETEIGDGTTTAVIIAGELLKKAEDLIDKEIHPTVIINGYRIASQFAITELNEMSEQLDNDNLYEIIKCIGMTAMTGKGAENHKLHLAHILYEAVNYIRDKNIVDRQAVKFEKKVGGNVDETELIKGIVISKEPLHSEMPKKLENAKIALIEQEIAIKNTTTDAKIQISSPEQLMGFLDQEEKIITELVNKIKESGANVVVCQKSIDEVAQHLFVKHGIMAIRRVKKEDLEMLSKSTGAKIITNIKSMNQNDLGEAGLVEEQRISNENLVFFRNCKNPKAVTILIRGGTDHVVDEISRAMEDALGDITSAIKNGRLVAGAGSTEMELSKRLNQFSQTLTGRVQLAVKAFAEAFESIPITLAENAGLDPIDVMTDLKAEHDKGFKWSGINVFTGKSMNAWEGGVIEPLAIKTQAITSATEVAIMILRIDDIIAGSINRNNLQARQGGM